MQFYSQLNETINQGEIIPIDEAEQDFENMMRDHSQSRTLERAALRDGIKQHIKQMQFSRPNNPSKPSLIHTVKMGNVAVEDWVDIIFQCALLIRKAIEQYQSWKFGGSLLSTPELARLSSETESMLGLSLAERSHHSDFSQSKLDRQERNIQRLKDVIIRNNPFDMDVLENKTWEKLINITNNMVIPQDITENILNAEARGKEA